MKKSALILMLCLFHLAVLAGSKNTKTDNSRAISFFYRVGEWVDNFLLSGLDTNYITLPEHCWRVAVNGGSVGVNSKLVTTFENFSSITLLTRTTPSAGLGFSVGYRGYGGGYTWDLMHAYGSNLNLSLGSKNIGLEFSRQVSTNITGDIFAYHREENSTFHSQFGKGYIWITNTHLNLWYALNSAHYSHNAAIKQSYIQRRSAGSLLLSLSYRASELSVQDTLTYRGVPIFSIMTDGVTRMITHQVSVGLGYGINYTPNKGKVLLHAAAYAQLVCYSIDQISIAVFDSIKLPGVPRYDIKPSSPVHVTGNVRAAVSWEINKWVHLSACALAYHIRFKSHDDEANALYMGNWNWQAQISIGVRFGAGRDRVQKALAAENAYPRIGGGFSNYDPGNAKLPRWLTDFFFSP